MATKFTINVTNVQRSFLDVPVAVLRGPLINQGQFNKTLCLKFKTEAIAFKTLTLTISYTPIKLQLKKLRIDPN